MHWNARSGQDQAGFRVLRATFPTVTRGRMEAELSIIRLSIINPRDSEFYSDFAHAMK